MKTFFAMACLLLIGACAYTGLKPETNSYSNYEPYVSEEKFVQEEYRNCFKIPKGTKQDACLTSFEAMFRSRISLKYRAGSYGEALQEVQAYPDRHDEVFATVKQDRKIEEDIDQFRMIFVIEYYMRKSYLSEMNHRNNLAAQEASRQDSQNWANAFNAAAQYEQSRKLDRIERKLDR